MEKQAAGTPLPHDPPRMRKDVESFPQLPKNAENGHAAWNDWPWKLHRINVMLKIYVAKVHTMCMF